jgi:hypothetical protein
VVGGVGLQEVRVLVGVCGGVTSLLLIPALCFAFCWMDLFEFKSVFASRPEVVPMFVWEALGRGKVRVNGRKE